MTKSTLNETRGIAGKQMVEPTFLITILTFPSVIFTILLTIVVAYWLFVIIGALDIHVFSDFHLGNLFSLAGTPLPVTSSIFILWNWILTTLGTYYFVLPTPDVVWQFLMGLAVFTFCSLLSFYLTTQVIRPFQQAFLVTEIPIGDKLIGKTCVISTLRVDEKFGEAFYKNNRGTEILLYVRATLPNTLTKGSNALIISYSATENTYIVTSYDDVLN